MSTPISLTDTEIQGNLKRVYADFRTKLFPIATPLLAQIKKEGPAGAKNMKWGGAGTYFDIVTNAPTGWTASSAGYTPRSSQQTEVQGTLSVARMYVSRTVDGLGLVGTASKEGAYASLRTKVLDEIDAASQLGLQEMLHGDSNGVVAIIASGASATSCTATSPYGYANAGQGGLWITPGAHLACLTSGGTLRGKAIVSAVSHAGDTATITLAASGFGTTTGAGGVTPNATDVLVRCTDSDTAYQSYPNGLGNILNRAGSYATLHGQSASSYTRWDTTRATAGTTFGDATAPNELDVQRLAGLVGPRGGVDPIANPNEFVLTGPKSLEIKFAESMIGQRRFAATSGEALKLAGGYNASVLISGLRYISDPWAPAGEVKLIHTPSMFWIDARDWSPVSYEDSTSWNKISGRDAYETSYAMYFNTGTIRRNAHAILSGYTDTERFTPVM